MMPTVVSFFTPTWEYQRHADRLRSECESLGVSSRIVGMPATGSWIGNTRLKPFVIRDALAAVDGPILWIDVDGSLLKRPDLLAELTVDFAGRHQRTGPKRTWHVGTMFFNNTPPTRGLVDKWCEATEGGRGSDEAAFDVVWLKWAEELGVTSVELPEAYFHISSGTIVAEPHHVITHRLSECESKMEMKRRRSLGIPTPE